MSKKVCGSLLYNRISALCFAVMFVIYALMLGIPLHTLIPVLILVLASVIVPGKVCRSIPLIPLKGLFIDLCGFVAPITAAVTILVCGSLNVPELMLMVSISTALAILHTYITKKTVLVNIARYVTTFLALSLAILDVERLLFITPFAVVIGIALGSDLMTYIISYGSNKNGNRGLIIGGYKFLDSIAISFTQTVAALTIILLIVSFISRY